MLTAARQLACPPWELLDPDDPAPRHVWIELANGAAAAEAHARNPHGG